MFNKDKQPQSIDFLQPVYSPTDIWSTAYIWLSKIGKYFLIFVELVVLGVFFSRFILDEKSNDLKEEVNAKVLLLSNDAWKQNSSRYENFQYLLTDVKKIREVQKINSTVVSELISGIPASLSLQSFSYNYDTVSMSFLATNLESVKNYESALKNNPTYYDVKFSISKESSGITVRVSFSLIEPKVTK